MRPFDTNYSGRQVDIEFMQSIIAPKITPTELNLSFANNTKIVTGMQKIAQRFTAIFLTAVGDIKFDAEYGTSFWYDLLRGASQNSGQVSTAVSQALLETINQMQADDQGADLYGDIPTDEQIKTAKLLDYGIDANGGTVILRIGITNVEGDGYTYKLPVQAVRT